jgi:hypothetical protein
MPLLWRFRQGKPIQLLLVAVVLVQLVLRGLELQEVTLSLHQLCLRAVVVVVQAMMDRPPEMAGVVALVVELGITQERLAQVTHHSEAHHKEIMAVVLVQTVAVRVVAVLVLLELLLEEPQALQVAQVFQMTLAVRH